MSLLNEYNNKLTKLLEKIGDQAGDFWYRGQRNAKWSLRSGAIDRLTDEEVEVEDLIGYHEDLLELAKLIKVPGKRQLRDLELLAQLQHYGAATCLLDMTSNFNIALWFACQIAKEDAPNNKEVNGKVFIVPTDPTNNFLKVSSEELDKPIRYFLDPETKREVKKQISHKLSGNNKKPRFWCWEPRPLMSRVLSQSSRFIISSEDIPKEGGLYEWIEIDATHKEDLLLELEQQQGLKPQNIFSDIPGLATVNARGTPHRLKEHRTLMRDGKSKMQEGDFEGAIEVFKRANKLKSNDPYTLFNLGDARIQWGNYLDREESWKSLEEAETDLYKALRLAEIREQQELQNQIEEKLSELEQTKEGFEDYFSELEEEARSALQDA